MTEHESKTTNNVELPPSLLQVRLGQPFALPSRLPAIEQAYEDDDARLETIPLAVESLGPGRVVLYRDGSAVREALQGMGRLHPPGFRTPAGPLRLSIDLADGRTRLDPNTLPLSLFVYLDALPAALLPTQTEDFITCTLRYGDRRFAGLSTADTAQTGPVRELAFLAWAELPAGSERPAAERLRILFPQDAAVLRRITLSIRYEP